MLPNFGCLFVSDVPIVINFYVTLIGGWDKLYGYHNRQNIPNEGSHTATDIALIRRYPFITSPVFGDVTRRVDLKGEKPKRQ